jgi:hypothetical protein
LSSLNSGTAESSRTASNSFSAASPSGTTTGKRGNAVPKMKFKALRNVNLDPWRIGKIVAAALVLLHFDHARTT